MEYTEFCEEQFNQLVTLQNTLEDQYHIQSYTNWFYDSESSLLRLYNTEKQIYFKHIPVGTYSFQTHTWMWSWFNESSLEKNKNETLKIKDFGIEKHYEKLYTGTSPADEYDGWEFVAIAQYLLKGIGAYKVVSGHLETYMLLTEIVEDNSPEIKKLKQKTVECKKHQLARSAFVCQHLNLDHPKGFEEAFDTFPGMDLDEDDNFQAWCDECEKVRVQHKGWNDESENFANIKLICEDCYFELKNFNQH
ncbi:DUF6882 domain-containing protein [Chryseobacterium sp.]|uniref:DUF6882 domain-containing protein n=1 Tax=Chryseobacterium sp. TaxID=1871047 RepID=UPI0025C442E8|nr:DUF6882 domain-containing protein [Chryseobacterium sp.]